MAESSAAVIFADRMPVAALEKLEPQLLRELRRQGLGKTDQKQRLQFCGLVCLPDQRSAVFVPRGGLAQTTQTARLTLRALTRFAKETSTRDFQSDGGEHGAGALSVIHQLAQDFQTNGLFKERQRVSARQGGKPDWPRTIAREMALHTTAGTIIYPQIRSTKGIDSSQSLLTRVQASVLGEILMVHGWWLEGIPARRAELRQVPKPDAPRSHWVSLLRALLPRLYSQRSVFLTQYLIHYLDDTRQSGTGAQIFGLEDFHSVWETMLRQTVIGVEDHWNRLLPRPNYLRADGQREDAPQRGMRTDIIARKADDYMILDAKYFEATSAQSAPGIADIAKQYLYEHALKSVIPVSATVRNAFVFPALAQGTTELTTVKMMHASGATATGLSSIECHYLDMHRVMRAYVEKQRNIPLPELGAI